MEGFHAFGSIDLYRLPHPLHLFERLFLVEPEAALLHFHGNVDYLLRHRGDRFCTLLPGFCHNRSFILKFGETSPRRT